MKRKPPAKKKKRYLLFFFLIVFGVFVVAVFGDKGLIDVFRLKNERDRILGFNRSLDNENRDLEENIHLLKTDKRYIEHMAREELGMIGKNEVLYKIED